MIPNTDDALRMIAQRMFTQLLPQMASEYAMSDGMMLGLLMGAIADEIGEGINRRLIDITQMQAILVPAREKFDVHEQADLDRVLPDYTLKAVNERHDALTRLLIKLHQLAEEEADTPLLQRVWGYLRETAERHKIVAVP